MFNNLFENHVIYGIKWKNIVEPGSPQMVIERMRISCCITKATNTQSEYEILIAFPLQIVLHERASMLRFTYIACLSLTHSRTHTQCAQLVSRLHTTAASTSRLTPDAILYSLFS